MSIDFLQLPNPRRAVVGMEDKLSAPVAPHIFRDDCNIRRSQHFTGYRDILCAQMIFSAAKRLQNASAAKEFCPQASLLSADSNYLLDQFTHGKVTKTQRCLILTDVHRKEKMINAADLGQRVPETNRYARSEDRGHRIAFMGNEELSRMKIIF